MIDEREMQKNKPKKTNTEKEQRGDGNYSERVGAK